MTEDDFSWGIPLEEWDRIWPEIADELSREPDPDEEYERIRDEMLKGDCE